MKENAAGAEEDSGERHRQVTVVTPVILSEVAWVGVSEGSQSTI
jgi:hypothetical protein